MAAAPASSASAATAAATAAAAATAVTAAGTAATAAAFEQRRQDIDLWRTRVSVANPGMAQCLACSLCLLLLPTASLQQIALPIGRILGSKVFLFLFFLKRAGGFLRCSADLYAVLCRPLRAALDLLRLRLGNGQRRVVFDEKCLKFSSFLFFSFVFFVLLCYPNIHVQAQQAHRH